MKVGIVGMPNAGKSSLFNALSKAGKAEAANYPFTTIEPNVAVVPVRDERLVQLGELIGASNLVFDTIQVHDIAGLVAGAHKGEGLGNQFLANIRETDAILHVVRCHDDENVIHPEGRVDPLADIETIETELIYADLEAAERRMGKVVREARGGDKAVKAEEAWLARAI
jgi:ribosome-binding ATPase